MSFGLEFLIRPVNSLLIVDIHSLPFLSTFLVSFLGITLSPFSKGIVIALASRKLPHDVPRYDREVGRIAG